MQRVHCHCYSFIHRKCQLEIPCQTQRSRDQAVQRSKDRDVQGSKDQDVQGSRDQDVRVENLSSSQIVSGLGCVSFSNE